MKMNELLKKIYNEILVYEKDIASANKTVDHMVEHMLKPYKETLSESEYDDLKNLLYSAVSIAEQTGFENGVRFTLKALHALLNI